MALSRPVNPVFVTEPVLQPTAPTLVSSTENTTRINQLHGVAGNNTQGAGIPKQVSSVQVSIANAQDGATCTVSVLYRVDPTDTNFSGVNIWVKGYQGNSQLVQVSTGTSSPCKFVLNNTGETVSFTVQAFGNSGNAPLSNAPTNSGVLPKSTSGGFGSSTTNYYNVNNPPPSSAPQVGPRPSIKNWRLWSASGSTTNEAAESVGCQPSLTVPVLSSVAPTGTDPVYLGIGTGTGSGAQAIFGDNRGAAQPRNVTLAILSRIEWRVQLQATTSERVWLVLNDHANSLEGVFVADTPAANLVGFRYSTHASDTTWIAYCGTDATHLTTVNTGKTVDTNGHVFAIQYAAGVVTFYIDGKLVATISTNVPSSTQVMGNTFSIDNVGTTNAKVLNVAYSYTETNV